MIAVESNAEFNATQKYERSEMEVDVNFSKYVTNGLTYNGYFVIEFKAVNKVFIATKNPENLSTSDKFNPISGNVSSPNIKYPHIAIVKYTSKLKAKVQFMAVSKLVFFLRSRKMEGKTLLPSNPTKISPNAIPMFAKFPCG